MKALVLATFLLGAQGPWQAPWSVNKLAPVTPDATKVQKRAPAPKFRQTNLPKIYLLGAVRFYQVAISPADGSSCELYPTCSGYAMDTLRKHGPVVGFVMTSERVMRNHTGEYYPGIYKFGRWRNHDPVEFNDFWFPWERKKAAAAAKARAAELAWEAARHAPKDDGSEKAASGFRLPATEENPK